MVPSLLTDRFQSTAQCGQGVIADTRSRTQNAHEGPPLVKSPLKAHGIEFVLEYNVVLSCRHVSANVMKAAETMSL